MNLESIIIIKGNVRHVITLDPTVWIFDDRRIDLETYFTDTPVEKDEIEEYKRVTGKHWSREIMEGATVPPTLKSEKKYEKTQMLTGTFGIHLHHFLKNAEPAKDALSISFETVDGENHTFPLTKVDDIIFKFSAEGQPLREDGPVHVLLKDGTLNDNPIRNVIAIRID